MTLASRKLEDGAATVAGADSAPESPSPRAMLTAPAVTRGNQPSTAACGPSALATTRGTRQLRVSVAARAGRSGGPTSAVTRTLSGPSSTVATIAAGPPKRKRVCHCAVPRDGTNVTLPPPKSSVGRACASTKRARTSQRAAPSGLTSSGRPSSTIRAGTAPAKSVMPCGNGEANNVAEDGELAPCGARLQAAFASSTMLKPSCENLLTGRTSSGPAERRCRCHVRGRLRAREVDRRRAMRAC